MKRFYLIITILFVGVSALWSQHANVIWNTPSRNSSESMPCGGGDIGMNIWVEDGDVMFYVSRSGTFDENNCQLKQGRVRLRLSPNPFKDAKDFRQELKLKDGYVEITAGKAKTECSGNVTRENIENLKKIGVDYISCGALTHSAPILDVSLKNFFPYPL